MQRHALPVSFFSTLFFIIQNTSSSVIWWCSNTEPNKKREHPGGSGLKHFLSKTCSYRKKKHIQVCQARVVSCCSDILLLSSFFPCYPNTKKERRKESKSNFFKRNDRNLFVCGYVFTNHHRPRSKRHKEYFCKLIDAVVLRLHNHLSCRPVRCLLQQTKSHTTPSISQAPLRDEARLWPVLLPTIRWTKRKYKWVDYELQKAPHGHKEVFPVSLSLRQKSDLQTGHLSEGRSFAILE